MMRCSVAVFAPPSENATEDYAAGVAAKVGENANPHDPAVRKALCKAILQTGKVYRRMTLAEQAEAKVYAGIYDNNVYIGLIQR